MPERRWCRMYAEQCDLWTELGGVPDDHSTREIAAGMLLALWAEYQSLRATLDELLSDA